jgi:hypothetical protein
VAVDLLYPWEKDKLVKNRMLKQADFEVLDDLERRYLQLRTMNAPKEKLLRVIRRISTMIIDMDKKEETPWMLIASNSTVLLQAIALRVPTTIALNAKLRPENVTTEAVIDLFKAPRPIDDFSLDPAGESLHKLKRCGLLTWENFGTRKQGAVKFEASFVDLLSFRLSRKLATLFLCSVPSENFRKKDEEMLFRKITESFGSTVPSMIQEVAVLGHYKVRITENRFFKEEA